MGQPSAFLGCFHSAGRFRDPVQAGIGILQLEAGAGYAASMRRYKRPAFEDEIAAFCLTPEAVNIQDVLADTSDWDLEKPLPRGGLKKQPFLLREAVTSPATANLCPRGFATAQPFDIVLVRSWHDLACLRLRRHAQHIDQSDLRG